MAHTIAAIATRLSPNMRRSGSRGTDSTRLSCRDFGFFTTTD